MLITELNNREEILSQVSDELKALGVRIKPPKCKIEHKRTQGKKVFNVPFHNLELADGILSNGVVCEIPRFLLMACTRIQDESKTEGLFRKTGSKNKQQLIQQHVENGGTLEKFHVIDVANLLKSFIRDLPTPLIPTAIQDSLINCFICCSRYEYKLEAVLMTCLFLPPIALNTLAYFLQFLEVITKNSQENLMTVENLVKVLTPSIMPSAANVNPNRLHTLFSIMEMLIRNASVIGVVPDRMIKSEDLKPPMTEERKKKKRRSASLNRVFNGFRKRIKGAISGSTESLDKSSEGVIDEESALATPLITKSAKKRRLEKFDIGAFSSKKKNNHPVMTLSSLPEIDDGCIPVGCSPYGKNKKNTRKSLGENAEKKLPSPAKNRRSSFVREIFTHDRAPAKKEDPDYVRVSKNEYEAFKTRLNTIETRINKEFQTAKLHAVKSEMGKSLNGPEKVEYKLRETLQEVEKFEDPEGKTDFLAKRLSRELKIRPHIENPVIRSPSARKIGSLRRKKDSATRLSRGNSWHISSTFDTAPTTDQSSTFNPKPNLKRLRMLDTSTMSNVPSNINTLPAEKVIPEKPVRKTATNSLTTETWTNATEFFKDMEPSSVCEQRQEQEIFKTPVRMKKLQIRGDIDLNNTPMLPPRLTTPISRTPMSEKKSYKTSTVTPSTNEGGGGREARASIIQIRNQNAGQVAQKAKLFDNMFDNLSESLMERPTPIVKLPRVAINKKLESVKNISDTPSSVPSSSSNRSSPRRSERGSRSPGINRRFQLRGIAQKSPMLKTLKENHARNHKINLLKNPELLGEIASPRTRSHETRKVLSQNNTPRRGGSRTPTSAKKYRTPHRNTPSKSPRNVNRRRHEISFD